MCILVDANRAHSFRDPNCPHGKPILDAVRGRKSKLVIGGEVSRELAQAGCGKLLQELDRAGMCIRVSDTEMARVAKALTKSNLLGSDDPHVIAAAQISGARLLYSHDDALITDFKKSELLASPRGKVYKSVQNLDTLQATKCAEHC